MLQVYSLVALASRKIEMSHAVFQSQRLVAASDCYRGKFEVYSLESDSSEQATASLDTPR